MSDPSISRHDHGAAPGWILGVYSIWRRHALVYRRTWLSNFLPPVTEPLLYLLSFGYGLAPLVGKFQVHGREVGYLGFIAPAMIGVGVCFQSFFEGAYGSYIRLRIQRTWHAMLTAPLALSQVFLGELLWAATRGVLGGVITGLVTIALGQVTFPELLSMLPLVVAGSLLFASVGIAVAGLVKSIDQVNVPVFLFILPMFTLCGTFFPRSNMPPLVAEPAGLLPMALLVDLLRGGASLGLGTVLLKSAGLLAWTLAGSAIAWKSIRPRVYY